MPSLRARFFRPVAVRVLAEGAAAAVGGGTPTTTEHLVIGRAQEQPDLVAPSAPLVDFMWRGFTRGLSLNHPHREQLVVLAQVTLYYITLHREQLVTQEGAW